MLSWSLAFFVVAIIAAILGFGGIAASAAFAAKIIFLGALVMAIVSLLFSRRATS